MLFTVFCLQEYSGVKNLVLQCCFVVRLLFLTLWIVEYIFEIALYYLYYV